MDEISLQEDDQRDFSWERHYPGDEGYIEAAPAIEGSARLPPPITGPVGDAGPSGTGVKQGPETEVAAQQEPYLQPAELPGSYSSKQLPSPEADLPGTSEGAQPPSMNPSPPEHLPEVASVQGRAQPEATAAGPVQSAGVTSEAVVQPLEADAHKPTDGAEKPAAVEPQQARTPAAAASEGGGSVPPAAGPAVPSAAAAEKDDGSGTDTDEDGELIAKARQKAALEKQRATAAIKRAGGGTGRPRAGGGITLKLLIDEGILAPGENVLTVEYKSSMTHASLGPDGRITCVVHGQEMVFESPSAFSIFLKRLVNPSRKADDGWKTVKYNGRFLEQFKLELARRRFGDREEEGASDAIATRQIARPRVPTLKSLESGAAAALEDGPSEAPASRPRPVASPREGSAPKKPRLTGPAANGAGMYSIPAYPRLTGNGYSDDNEYLKNRPKRQIKPPTRPGFGHHEEHQMVPCALYRGPVCSGAAAQPFHIVVAPAAELIMDFHAHLSTCEVIGILGGTWDQESRTLRVVRAVPVREIAIEDGSINVEMDPEDQFRAVEGLQPDKLTCVGWYHSHPHFAAQPSIIDIHNQVTQQHQFRAEGSADEPYIAAIVGPYDEELSGNASHMTWFHVQHEAGRIPAPDQDPLQAGCRPMALQVDVDNEALILLPLQGEMQALSQRYAGMASRVDLNKHWRNGHKRIDKLQASLAARIPKSWPAEMGKGFLEKIAGLLSAAFAAVSPPKKASPDEDVEISELTEDGPAAMDTGRGEEAASRRPGSATNGRRSKGEDKGDESEDSEATQ